MAPQAATLLPFAATIPVRRELWQRDAECLDYALRTHQDQGIWGGIPGRKLRRLRHQLEAEAVAS